MAGANRGGSFIETYTGERFYPFDPRPEEIHLEDIASGLSHICRFGGHCRHFYSVALHSLYVSCELAAEEPRVQLVGLLHDAGEAYLGDLPRPIKAEFETFESAEEHLLEATWIAFDINPPTPDEWEQVKAADDRLLAYEASEILTDGSWAGESPALNYDLRVDSVEATRDRFLGRAETLLSDVRD